MCVCCRPHSAPMSGLQIITTADGSHSLFNPDLAETYHSTHGAVQESKHVFIAQGLQHWLRQTGRKTPLIFEVGFGTGLNAWLTHEVAIAAHLKVKYFTVEAFPLQREVWTQLNYAPGDDTYSWLHETPWDVQVLKDDAFTMEKRKGKLEDVIVPEFVDIIYFDAFAPSKQPELWTLEVLEKVCSKLQPDGFLVTYCARGQLKRDLRTLGLLVETLPGPPGKKEMVRASRRQAEK